MVDHTRSHHFRPKSETHTGFEDLWLKKRLTPHQLLVHDVRLEELRPNREPRLECREKVVTEIIPQTAVLTPSSRFIRASEAARNPIELQRLTELEEEFGWMSTLRIPRCQDHVSDSSNIPKVRWMYVYPV